MNYPQHMRPYLGLRNTRLPLYTRAKSHLWAAMLVSLTLLTTCEQIQQCIIDGTLRQCWNYICTNGTPAEGVIDVKSTERCTSCNDGFNLVNDRCEEGTVFVCLNGTPKEGTPSKGENTNHCIACKETYHLDGTTCEPNTYECENGTRYPGRPIQDGQMRCATCDPTYIMEDQQCNTRTKYTCNNGTPRATTNENRPQGNSDTEECASCSPGYRKQNNLCVNARYTCANGVPQQGNPAGNEDQEKCQTCLSTYRLVDDNCNTRTKYTCSNGVATAGSPAGNSDMEQCQSCTNGYIMMNSSCVFVDTDADTVPDPLDVDDDNDGLIEILNLTMLHNMRYNLAGTSYDDEAADTGSADTGSTNGAPTAVNKAADYACSTASGLCGYELTHNLSFDTDNDFQTWSGSGGSHTLDGDDSADPYFVVANGGWLPIGDNTNPFVAIFEGNGHIISYVAIQRNQTYTGMFGVINTGAHIRNVGLVHNLADYSGTSNSNTYIGGLVGRQNGGSITSVYTTGSVNGGTGEDDFTGGLVGQQAGGSITASYATGSTSGGAGSDDYTGGLVGVNTGGSITASYATGNVVGGTGTDDSTGGLVGVQTGGSITASYATGSVNDDGNENDDSTGGLVGEQQAGSITASYATGSTNSGTGVNVSAGKLVGRQTGGSITASYGFGTRSGSGLSGIAASTLPTGVTTAVALTSANLTGCVGIANEKAYTSQTTCQATSKTACTWSGGTCSGPVTGIDCSLFTTQSTCVATTKSAGTWNGDIWNAAASDTAGAWDFGTGSQVPALRYADFDGAGTDYNCNQFPSNVTCGTTLLPGQR